MPTIELKEQRIPRECFMTLPEIEGGIFHLLESTYNPQTVFDAAQNDWHEIFEPDRIIGILNQLAVGPDTNEIEHAALRDKLLLIKLLRKPGTRLVDAWRLLNQDNQYPQPLSALVDEIGKYKDLFWYPSQRNRITSQLITAIDNYQNSEGIGFVPQSFESFKATYDRFLADIRTYIDQPELSLHYFHKLRYRVRTLRHYYSLTAAATGNHECKTIADFLEPISFEMGKSEDQIHKLKQAGAVNIYQDSACIEPRHLQIIREFLIKH